MKKLNSYETLVDAIEIRENHYEKYLGKLNQPILSPAEKIYPHIEIYQIAPTPQKPYWTLITSGMSDARQNIPLDNKRTSGRTEFDESVRRALERELGWALLDDIHLAKRLPVDKRHNAKIDYPALLRMLHRE